MKKNKKCGISLIVLLITILVIMILLTTVLLSMKDQHLTDSAFEVRFKEKIESYRTDIEDYILKKEVEEGITYDKKLLDANVEFIMYDGKVVEGNIFSILHSMTEEDSKLFIIKNGHLIYYPYKVNSGQIILSTEDFLEEEFEISSKTGIISYSTNGLIGYYEATNNAGGAYSNKAVIWKDLSLKNNDATINKISNECWTEESFSTNGNNVSANFKINIPENSSFTIETVYKDKDNNNTLFLIDDSISLDKIQGSETKDKIYKVMYIYDAANKTLKTYNLSGGIEQTQSKTINGIRSISIPQSVNKEYYTIRVYDRIINSVDSASNSSIDALRFENIN